MKGIFFFFGELTDQDVDWLVAHGRRVPMPVGTDLVHEGKRHDQLDIILEGDFGLIVHGRGQLTRMGVGSVVGEISFVDSRPPSGTVRALTPALVLSVPAATLTAKLRKDAEFAARFYRALAMMLAYRLRVMTAQLAGTSHPDTDPPDQLDMNVMDNVHLAGARFNRMLKSLQSA
jgi:CRP-like cAMP-binding protein